MPTSEAKIEANRRNAALSTGPKTDDGKSRSRGNALKHGLSGAGIVLPEEDAAEVERKSRAMMAEMNPSTEVSKTLVRRIATLAVRMNRCVEVETAYLTDKIERAIDEVEVPEGATPEEVQKRQAEAANLALFDTSKESTQIRKYEAAAERGFFRALKEFRQVEREARSQIPAQTPPAPTPSLGSFEPRTTTPPKPIPTPTLEPRTIAKPAIPSPNPAPIARDEPTGDAFYVPIAVGKAG